MIPAGLVPPVARVPRAGFLPHLNLPFSMKTSLLSVFVAFAILASTNAASAAAPAPYDHANDRHVVDTRHMSPGERARYEATQRENDRKLAQARARYEAAQRKNQRENERRLAQERARLEAQRRADQQRAAEQARYDAQHRNDRHDDRGRDYGYNNGRH
jgi:flagellar motility protein MotE (MotC chaperone)